MRRLVGLAVLVLFASPAFTAVTGLDAVDALISARLSALEGTSDRWERKEAKALRKAAIAVDDYQDGIAEGKSARDKKLVNRLKKALKFVEKADSPESTIFHDVPEALLDEVDNTAFEVFRDILAVLHDLDGKAAAKVRKKMDKAAKYMDRYSDERTEGNYKKAMQQLIRGLGAYLTALKVAQRFL